MGRLAGISIAQQARETWKARVAAEREAKREGRGPQKRERAPHTQPPESRRLVALLWNIARWPDGYVVNAEDSPPLTPDLRLLIRRGYVVLERRTAYSVWAAVREVRQRESVLRLTAAGRAHLAGTVVSEAERAYIRSALVSGTLR
ncbi:hypothetical protein SAMN05880582_1011540 [Rhizobium sp. RU20A]|uniref:hypothetical protein n=1 Tax=Rhizobium sp. RU20A TaxID=1907412 RepID=UPI000955A3A6|nr:hypothetical protein [Rhizobium sp. RU20A]SIQ34333.1 hypothetical protein SAMN05880582_1011540 [Rhizobium sp. RU20A]